MEISAHLCRQSKAAINNVIIDLKEVTKELKLYPHLHEAKSFFKSIFKTILIYITSRIKNRITTTNKFIIYPNHL